MSFISWCQNNNDTLSLRARYYNDTTAYAKVPISYIKKANVKLIERKYYIKLNAEKDSIINYKNQYIDAQSVIIKSLSDDYTKAIKVNENIKDDLNKQQEKTKRFVYTTIGASALLLISILIK